LTIFVFIHNIPTLINLHVTAKTLLMLTRYRIIFLLIISVSFGRITSAQDIYQDETSTRVYKKIKDFSAQRKITNTIHDLFLKPISPCSAPPHEIQEPLPCETYANFEGKVIRNILITTLDPFGYSLQDTAVKPHDFISKGGNALHIKTQTLAIRNRLLIKKNDRFDSLMIKESERLIRNQSYIHDVTIRTVAAGPDSDSVDIFIRVSDLWSIVPDGAISGSSFTIELSDKNLGGFGHTFSNRLTQNYLNGNNSYSAYYYIPNINNTYISSRIRYAVDEDRNYLKSLSVERPFFSPVTRWAGGIYLSQEMSPAWIYKNDSTRLYLNSKYNIQINNFNINQGVYIIRILNNNNEFKTKIVKL